VLTEEAPSSRLCTSFGICWDVKIMHYRVYRRGPPAADYALHMESVKVADYAFPQVQKRPNVQFTSKGKTYYSTLVGLVGHARKLILSHNMVPLPILYICRMPPRFSFTLISHQVWIRTLVEKWKIGYGLFLDVLIHRYFSGITCMRLSMRVHPSTKWVISHNQWMKSRYDWVTSSIPFTHITST
jgi:hypothetical protein